MARRLIILDVAKPDFRDIKRYVKSKFGDTIWNEVNQEFKDTIKQIAGNPEAGTPLEELGALGLDNFRKSLVRQTRIIYEFNDVEVLVHMFIHTRRDFRNHLEKRILS